MPKNKKSRKNSPRPSQPVESRASEALTIAWTVTVTTLLFCHLATLGAHFYVSSNPDARKMLLLREMLLFAAAIVGVLSLTLLPFVYRLRRLPPPPGIVAFGICLAVAPILVLALRAMG